MHRDDWSSVFTNQDRILEQLKPLENEMFLAGGTGLQRFVLPMPYRHSEDLDFFFSTLKTNKELENIKNKIVELITNLDGAKLDREPIWRKEEKSWRMFFAFNDNDEIIKIELLNFTCDRLKDLSFANEKVFKTENLYNLLLYKLKALCDRPDTIKDLFDIYFILRDLESINIDTLINDMNKKFENAIGIKYSLKDIVTVLNHRLQWDIEVGEDIKHLQGMKLEIDLFQKELQEAFKEGVSLDFNFQSKIQKKAKIYGLEPNDYVELVEENKFIVDEWKNIKLKRNNKI
jgi:predicted nucleotidyltransferase component of viral defense system